MPKTAATPKEYITSRSQINEHGCWLWQGVLTNGRGQARWGGIAMSAHRFSASIYKGEIPAGAIICHKCNVAHCVNPEHLYFGTYQSNYEDARRAGTMPTGSKHWLSKLSAEQVSAIREEYATGKIGVRPLARKFGVKHSSIWSIITGKTHRESIKPGSYPARGDLITTIGRSVPIVAIERLIESLRRDTGFDHSEAIQCLRSLL